MADANKDDSGNLMQPGENYNPDHAGMWDMSKIKKPDYMSNKSTNKPSPSTEAAPKTDTSTEETKINMPTVSFPKPTKEDKA